MRAGGPAQPSRRLADGVGAMTGTRRDSDPTTGIMLTIGFSLSVPWSAALVKMIDASAPAGQISAIRFALQTLILAAFLLARRGWPLTFPRPLTPYILRGSLMSLGSVFLYAGIRAMPLADAAAIFFIQPLLVTALAGLILREPVGWRRGGAVLVGMIGAWIIIGPKFEEIGWTAIYPALSAITFTFVALITRSWGWRADVFAMQLVGTASASITLVALALIGMGFGWAEAAPVWLSPGDWGLILVIGAVSSVTSLMLTQAFRRTSAAIIAPFQYLELAGSALAGYVIFAEKPGVNSWIGAALVLAAGLFVWARERRLAHPRKD